MDLLCNNAGSVYINGVKMIDCVRDGGKNIIPKTTRVIAIRASNGGGEAYIEMYVSNGFRTANDTWRCTDKFNSGWQNVDYDDS